MDRRAGAFNLGRFELPVAVGALVWMAVVLFVVVSPTEARVPVALVAGLGVAGGLYFLWLLRTRREVLDTEPGDLSVYKH